MLNHTDWLNPLPLAQLQVPEWVSGAGNLLLVLAGFSIVVFFHELGHFLAAKWAGVRVERFAVGFGRELVGFTRGETRYSLNLLPLGGYVKMLGQEDFAVDKEGELKVRDNPDSFTSKSVGKRMVIVSAGVIMNLLFAAVAFTVVTMVGRNSIPAIVGYVDPTSAAMRAGIQPGDKILAVNDKPIRSFEDLFNAVTLSDQNEELVLTIERDGKIVDPSPHVLPEYKSEAAIRQVGLATPMTRRIMLTAARMFGYTPADELRPNDLLVAIGAGPDARPVKHLGEVMQALTEARGLPITLTVDRPEGRLSFDALTSTDNDVNVKVTPLAVKAAAVWRLLPSEGADPGSCSLLGLVPRLVIYYPVDANSPAALGGLKLWDIITRVGAIQDPTYAEFLAAVDSHNDRDLHISVRRPSDANGRYSAPLVALLTQHRDALIRTARRDLAAARTQLADLVTNAALPPESATIANQMAASLKTADAWREWLGPIDIHELVVRPRAPASLFGPPGKPTLGVLVMPWEEDRIVISDVQDVLRGRTSPAKLSGIPRGAIITAVDDAPVSGWAELTEAFRIRAGKTVQLHYDAAAKPGVASFKVPQTISTILNLPPDATVTEIAGVPSAEIPTPKGPRLTTLPDWQVIEALLKKHVGDTVTVKYTTRDSKPLDGRMAVTENNTDPWLQRVVFAPSFQCYPLREMVRETNPFKALVLGTKRAYAATMQTYLTIKHLIFTREVGVQNISGPVGIIRRGSQIAEGSLTDLLMFLGLISANLAVINFLPMPIVDGGLFIFLLLEKIRGEPVSIKTQVVTQLIGIALIVSIFLFVTFQDIANWNR